MLKADLNERDTYEEKLARIVGRLTGAQRREAIRLLGDPPNISQLDNEFWTNASDELQTAVMPVIEDVALEAATALAGEIPIGVDWALVNQSAADWAASYTFDMVRGVNDTSRRAIARAVSRYFESGQTMGDLHRSLSRIYSANRAEMIAVTEVTRAAAQGELFIANDLRRQGVEMVAVWQTNRDSLVCPICGPLNGVRAVNGQFHGESGTFTSPPAHVRCRCWINHELPPVEVS